MTKINELSVFLPTYNEEKNIKEVVDNTKSVLENVAEKWELIVVDDGSIDQTGQIVSKLAESEKRIVR